MFILLIVHFQAHKNPESFRFDTCSICHKVLPPEMIAAGMIKKDPDGGRKDQQKKAKPSATVTSSQQASTQQASTVTSSQQASQVKVKAEMSGGDVIEIKPIVDTTLGPQEVKPAANVTSTQQAPRIEITVESKPIIDTLSGPAEKDTKSATSNSTQLASQANAAEETSLGKPIEKKPIVDTSSGLNIAPRVDLSLVKSEPLDEVDNVPRSTMNSNPLAMSMGLSNPSISINVSMTDRVIKQERLSTETDELLVDENGDIDYRRQRRPSGNNIPQDKETMVSTLALQVRPQIWNST